LSRSLPRTANLVAVEHVRESAEIDVRETGVVLTLETRGSEHADAVRATLRAEGYEIGEV
jgi:threonine dehydratase